MLAMLVSDLIYANNNKVERKRRVFQFARLANFFFFYYIYMDLKWGGFVIIFLIFVSMYMLQL